ncbi:MAG: ferredoxin--NADP reductase [Saprospirales bacterium]|nr:MAG: ferredoxin--NADP reductase [Saprospirales bacterium]
MSDQQFYHLKINSIIENTPEAKTIILEIPENLRERFQYKAGQYITLEVEISGKLLRRSYSLSSAPHEEEFAFTVKKVDGGEVSPFLVDGVALGDNLKVSSPEGRFTMEFMPEAKRTHYFFAAGSGITPVISLIKSCMEKEPMSEVFLLYCNRNPQSVIFSDELERLEADHQGQFFVNKTFTRTGKGVFSRLFGKNDKKPDGWKGRIDGQMLDRFFEAHPGRRREKHFFVCGPGPMIQAVVKHLERLGHSSDRIHKEYFTVDSTLKKSVEALDGARVKVELHGEWIEMVVPKGKSILAQLQDEGHDPPYSCTSGVCSSCMAKLISGKVEMETCLALDDSEVEEGFILTCQALPISEKVELTYEV